VRPMLRRGVSPGWRVFTSIGRAWVRCLWPTGGRGATTGEVGMRNVILSMSMSLDDLVGSDREHPGVAVPEVRYREMSSFWPQPADPYAAPMNDISTVVFSTTRSATPRPPGR
jgi:hypothetical protein